MWQRMKNYYHLLQALAANAKNGFPGRKLIVIGVTGTDGKTTTVNLIYHILKIAGKSVSMISTVGANIHGNTSALSFHVTNPSSFPLQKFLNQAASKKLNREKNYLVLEVTSHGLDQNRIWGVPIEVGVITNITPEHLDYHKTYDKYLQTKLRLLKLAKKIVLNTDCQSYKKLAPYTLTCNKPHLTYGLEENTDINPASFPFKTSLIGEFNKYNILAAVAACRFLGLDDEVIRKGIQSFITPSGRMNRIPNKRAIDIFIDYAHTSNGVELAVQTLREQAKHKLIVLIGAEGYRDIRKRFIIGEVAARLADYVIITAVDPRGLIDEINSQILEGAKQSGGKLGENIFIENDRQKAINFAINTLANKGDVVAILGKGHEKSMNMDGRHELSWSDFQAVEQALKDYDDR